MPLDRDDPNYKAKVLIQKALRRARAGADHVGGAIPFLQKIPGISRDRRGQDYRDTAMRLCDDASYDEVPVEEAVKAIEMLAKHFEPESLAPLKNQRLPDWARRASAQRVAREAMDKRAFVEVNTRYHDRIRINFRIQVFGGTLQRLTDSIHEVCGQATRALGNVEDALEDEGVEGISWTMPKCMNLPFVCNRAGIVADFSVDVMVDKWSYVQAFPMERGDHVGVLSLVLVALKKAGIKV